MVDQRHRVLPVRVDDWTVMDMNGPCCDLGETVELILGFREEGDAVPDLAPGSPADMVVTVGAWAQEYPDADPVTPDRLRWSTLLTGDGWSALWDAPRPVLGRVRLTGRFIREASAPWETRVAPTRGAVTVIRTTQRDGAVTEADGIRKPDADSGIASFLVDLDLDAASRPEPAPPGRPTARQGFAVTGPAETRALWRGDLRLPLVWRTDLASGMTTPVALPLKIGAAGRYLARVRGPLDDLTGDACRVVAAGRSFTVHGDGTFVEGDAVDDRPIFVDGAWRSVSAPDGGRVVSRYDRGEERIHTPHGGMYDWPVSSGVQRLGRVAVDGTVTWVREWEVTESDTVATLLTVGGQLMLWRRGVVQYLDDNLEVAGEVRLPDELPEELRSAFRHMPPATSGDFLVADGDGTLVVLDPADLSVILQVEVVGRARAQVDDRSTVWVADGQLPGDRLRVFMRDAAGEWTGREVDV
jgi:hypothetical protein